MVVVILTQPGGGDKRGSERGESFSPLELLLLLL